ncbi:unnamed protein product [Parnassius apollo]|uniref:(apollo) hypothetical protein n=1 Tax=Parnassius apollo TaxID=110799 RepID=A0A8S3XPG1_PARAO|nr:unnamed protein product [Parnassius apollo]
MPNCSVITCRKNSGKWNLKNGGISFHNFPGNPNIKKIWIEATGRLNWMPTKNSCICSDHFFETDFLLTHSKRYLKENAIPRKEIVQIKSAPIDYKINNSCTNPSTSNTCESDPLNLSERTTIASPISSDDSTPRERKLKEIIQDKEYVITKQRKQIKRIQAQNRRLNEKIKKLEDVLSKLQEKSL